MVREFLLGIIIYHIKENIKIREGYGTYYFGENNYYEGKWLNNLPHGEGKYNINGNLIEGLFRYGRIIKNKNGQKKLGNIVNAEFKNDNSNLSTSKKKKNSLK